MNRTPIADARVLFVTGTGQGWPLERAVRFGNATGAIVVTRHSCANDMPTLEEVECFVAGQGGWGFETERAATSAGEARHP